MVVGNRVMWAHSLVETYLEYKVQNGTPANTHYVE